MEFSYTIKGEGMKSMPTPEKSLIVDCLNVDQKKQREKVLNCLEGSIVTEFEITNRTKIDLIDIRAIIKDLRFDNRVYDLGERRCFISGNCLWEMTTNSKLAEEYNGFPDLYEGNDG